MNKKFLLSLFAFAIPTLLSAQITICTNDMPVAGHTYNMSQAATTGTIDFSTTGANHTWDFSSLTATTVTPDTFISNTQLPLVYIISFFTSNLAEHANGTSMNLGLTFAMTDVYNVYKNSSSSFKQTGFAGTLQGVQIPVIYNPSDEIYQFPLNYNNNFTSTSAYNFQLPTIASFFQYRTRTVTVDGWGTLILPGGSSYQVLRVKSDIIDNDSIYIDLAGFGFPIPRVTHEYKWIAVNKGLPMLQINTNDLAGNETVSSVRYQDFPNTSVTDLQSSENAFQIFPNPTSDYAFVLPSEKFQHEKLLITDVEGKLLNEIPVSNSSTTTIDLTAFSEGIYFVQFLNEGKIESVQKLVVNR